MNSQSQSGGQPYRTDQLASRDNGSSYVGPKEYAALKGVCVETVKRWCRKGLIPCERVGKLGHWRIAIDR